MAAHPDEMPAVGAKAPVFTLPSDQGKDVALTALLGKPVVLYFYPRDDTPGCTIEAKEFRDSQEDFEARGAVVLGVSADDEVCHKKFVAKFDLNFALLADTEHAVCEQYGVWVEKNMAGKKYMGIQRATFLIGPNGKIAYAWPKVKPEGHAEQVLAQLDALNKG